MSKKKRGDIEDNFLLLFDNLDEFAFILDAGGHIVKANRTVLKRLGYSERELMGRHVQVVLPEEIKVGSSSTAVPEIITAKDGSFIPVETRTTPGKWNGEDVIYSFSRDILKLIEAEERFDVIFRTHAVPMCISTVEDGRILEINDAALVTLGFTREETIGKTTAELNIYNDIKQREEMIKNFERMNCVRDFPLELRTKNGELRSVLYSADTIRLFTRPCLLSVINDITERKAAEDLVVTTRTRLEAADRAKKEFLAGISHELRTPLNGVIGMTGILLDTSLSPQQRDFAEAISNSADVLLGVLNDILDFSKVEAGKLSLETLDFDLRAALEEIAGVLATRAHQKGLEFMLIIEPAVPSLLSGDPGRLRQVLLNLAGNAVKFTPRGEVTVRVALEREQQQDAVLSFSVSDTGIGIPSEKLEYLFAAFTQGDGSNTRKYGGTGLGLPIAQQLVHLMGGTIAVESTVGKGSVFRFTVPFKKQPAAVLAEPEPSMDIKSDISGLRVLVTAENSVCRRLLSIMLASWKCRYQSALDGKAALKLLRAAARKGDPFRVALLDMNIPGMDGEALGTAVKKDAKIKDTHVIMMTGMGRRGDAARLQEIGFSGYLTKPIKQEMLRDCLAAVSSGRPPEHIVTRHSIAEAKRRKIHILVAEESATNRKLVLGILAKLGYRADVATDGVEALKAVEGAQFDLILMDCHMPRMDGYQATKEIRKREANRGSHIPVIAMTGSVDAEAKEKCTAAGMDDYIAKPVTPETVAGKIEKWLPGTESDRKAEVEIFDRVGLLDRLMEDEDLVEEIVGDFLQDIPIRFTALKEALAKGEIVPAHRLAHTIKGAAGNIGATALQKIAMAVETAAHSGDLKKTTMLFPLLEEQFGILKNFMQGSASGEEKTHERRSK